MKRIQKELPWTAVHTKLKLDGRDSVTLSMIEV